VPEQRGRTDTSTDAPLTQDAHVITQRAAPDVSTDAPTVPPQAPAPPAAEPTPNSASGTQQSPKQQSPTRQPPAEPVPDAAPSRRGPLSRLPAAAAGCWVWLGSFAVLVVALLARNSYLFTQHLYPTGDEAANWIITDLAERFQLLVGHYSQFGFDHPGPAFFYNQAWGQALFVDWLHVMPTDWNGQIAADMTLSAAMIATVVWIVHDWTRSRTLSAVTLAAALLFAVDHRAYMLHTPWPPDMFVMPFLLLIVASASVAAGRMRHLPALAFAAGLLINGYVAFLMFVPLLLAGVLVTAAWPRRREPRAWLAEHRRRLIAGGIVLGVFLLPIALDTVLHWPGQFGHYLHYGMSSHSHNSLPASLKYMLWYWSSSWPASAVAVPLVVALAVLLVVTRPRDAVRTFLVRGLWVCLATSVFTLYYTISGVTALSATYMEFFYYAVPLFVLLVIVLCLADRARGLAGRRAAGRARTLVNGALVGAAVAGCVAAMSLPAFDAHSIDTNYGVPTQPATLRAIEDRAGGRTIVLEVPADTWSVVDGLPPMATAAGLPRVCITGGARDFELHQYQCDAADLATGFRMGVVDLRVPGATIPAGQTEIGNVLGVALTAPTT
jgi:hypothetical protein